MTAGVGGFESPEGAVERSAADPSADVLSEAAAAFGLLASPARLHLVWALAQGESDVTGLAERVGGALPAISQHLAKLKLAGLVRSRREGRRVVYLVDDPHVVTIVRLMVDQLSDRRADPASRSRSGAASGRLRGLGA
ncbi:ArsR/SmtB family transcription factor [Streptomyces sp. URMC 126]|uniref:ArsR/SmtB family transcription factor n=1 Tax=Streptomyces sp. URMC 126 TaxID=3423401 RepID=UPI003F1D2E45